MVKMMSNLLFGFLVAAATVAVLAEGARPGTAQVSRLEGTGCDCQGTYTCGCCISLDIPQLNISETGCANVTYISDEMEFEFSVSLNGETVFEKDVSLANIPPVCLGLRQLLQVCGQLYDLDLEQTQISGCLGLEVWARGQLYRNLTLGCFTIPVGQTSRPLLFHPMSAPVPGNDPLAPSQDEVQELLKRSGLHQEWEKFLQEGASKKHGMATAGMQVLLGRSLEAVLKSMSKSGAGANDSF